MTTTPDHLYWVFRSHFPGESYGPFIDLAWAQAKATEIDGIVLGVRVTYTGVPAQADLSRFDHRT